jgi:hypothetical protein
VTALRIQGKLGGGLMTIADIYSKFTLEMGGSYFQDIATNLHRLGVEELTVHTANMEFSFDKSGYKTQQSIDIVKWTEDYFNCELRDKGKAHCGSNTLFE